MMANINSLNKMHLIINEEARAYNRKLLMVRGRHEL